MESCNKSMKLRVFVLLMLFVVLVSSSVQAIGCEAQGWKGYGKIHQNKTITITCPTCTFINFTAVNPSNIQFLSNVAMTQSGSTFSYTFLGDNLSDVGTYQVDGYSNLDDPLALCFDVTLSGREPSGTSYVTLIVLLVAALGLLIWLSIYFDSKRSDRLYNKIVGNYLNVQSGFGKGSMGAVIGYSFMYGLLRTLYVFYYLVIVLLLFVIAEMTDAFAITSLNTLFITLFNISLWGFVLVFIMFIFKIYEIIKELMLDIAKEWRGVGDGR